MYVYAYVNAYVCVYVYVYVCICIYIYIYMHICNYIKRVNSFQHVMAVADDL